MSFIALNGEIDIGKTERRLGDSIREHLRDVKNKNRHKTSTYSL